MNSQPQSIYEFGPYRLDTAKRLQSRDFEVVTLRIVGLP
jgi:hypothetical protein